MLSDLIRLALSRTRGAFTLRRVGSTFFSFREEEEAIKAMSIMRSRENWKNGKRNGSNRMIERERRDLRVEDSRKQRDNVKCSQ